MSRVEADADLVAAVRVARLATFALARGLGLPYSSTGALPALWGLLVMRGVRGE